jgi:hypothetical protein
MVASYRVERNDWGIGDIDTNSYHHLHRNRYNGRMQHIGHSDHYSEPITDRYGYCSSNTYMQRQHKLTFSQRCKHLHMVACNRIERNNRSNGHFINNSNDYVHGNRNIGSRLREHGNSNTYRKPAS